MMLTLHCSCADLNGRLANPWCYVHVQVPPKSRAALQVNEARLALLLQAVRTSLQMQSSSHSFRLAAVGITAQLARCQVKTQPASACCSAVRLLRLGTFQ